MTCDKLYLVFRKDWETVRKEDGSFERAMLPLGFAQAHEPGKKNDEKRKATQHDWAYGTFEVEHKDAEGKSQYHYVHTYRAEDGKFWAKGEIAKYKWDEVKRQQEKTHIKWVDEPLSDEYQPKIIDNVPMTGFKLLESVSRYSTQNKVWRVLDPRGFQLEISTATLEAIVLQATIVKGEIIGKCVWEPGRTMKLVWLGEE